MFGTRQHAGRRARALTFMSAYCKQLTTESRPGAVEELETMQLTGGIASNELDRLAAMLHGVDGASASRQGSVATADNLIMSLSNHRSERVALLLSVFPPLHWVTLGVLSALIVVTYLLVSNQDTLQYLDSIQLRFLFGTLVGVLSSTFTLCYDLADPLNGSFSMEGAAEQLKDLNLCLKEDVREALSELDDIDKRTRNYLRSVLVGADVPSPGRCGCGLRTFKQFTNFRMLKPRNFHRGDTAGGGIVRNPPQAYSAPQIRLFAHSLLPCTYGSFRRPGTNCGRSHCLDRNRYSKKTSLYFGFIEKKKMAPKTKLTKMTCTG